MSDQTTPTQEEALRAQAEFLNKVWTDEAFRSRLESDPKAVLEEIGGQVPDDVEIKVVRDSDTVKYLHIPAPPPEGEISDADLENAQGGSTLFCLTIPITQVVSLTITLNV